MQPMDKKTYLDGYNAEHPGGYVTLALGIICDIIGSILIFPNLIKIMDRPEIMNYIAKATGSDKEIITYFVWGGILWIAGTILMIVSNGIRAEGQREYERYLTNFYNGGNYSYNQYNNQNNNGIGYSRNTQVQSNSWSCPRCGNYNVDRLICTNCSQPKPYVVTGISGHQTPGNDVWRCPSCGRENQSYTGTCGCGQVKPEVRKWFCPKCGTPNFGNNCTNCGQKYPRK